MQASPMKRVAIIGSAGRGPEAGKMTPELFEKMQICAGKIMYNVWGLRLDQIVLVSGGSSFADHVAVSLWNTSQQLAQDIKSYKSCSKLQLYLPCEWDSKCASFDDNGKKWAQNPGLALNSYHKEFSKRCKVSSLSEISQALARPGASYHVSNGFHARNTHLALQCDYLIAFTFGESTQFPLPSGGTYDTWKKCTLANKIHVPLMSLVHGTYKYPNSKQLIQERSISQERTSLTHWSWLLKQQIPAAPGEEKEGEPDKTQEEKTKEEKDVVAAVKLNGKRVRDASEELDDLNVKRTKSS